MICGKEARRAEGSEPQAQKKRERGEGDLEVGGTGADNARSTPARKSSILSLPSAMQRRRDFVVGVPGTYIYMYIYIYIYIYIYMYIYMYV